MSSPVVAAKRSASAFHEFTNWQTRLRAVANQLEDLHTQAQQQLADDIGHPD